MKRENNIKYSDGGSFWSHHAEGRDVESNVTTTGKIAERRDHGQQRITFVKSLCHLLNINTFQLLQRGQEYLSFEGCRAYKNSCGNLHICLHYLRNDCKFNGKCKYSHNFRSPHNLPILKKYSLDKLSKCDIVPLLNIETTEKNRKALICKGYNSIQGCKFKQKCESLHLCAHYVVSVCKFGKTCERSHDLKNPQIKKLLMQKDVNPNQIPKQIIADLKKLINVGSTIDLSIGDYHLDESLNVNGFRKSDSFQTRKRKNDGMIFNSKRASKNDGISCAHPKICVYFLEGPCLRKNCPDFHQIEKLPYQWQYRDVNDDWINYAENILIEKAFCCCEVTFLFPNSRYNFNTEVNFEDMTFKDLRIKSAKLVRSDILREGPVRRLTTDSLLNPQAGAKYLTWWRWFYVDDLKWVEYQEKSGYPEPFSLEGYYQNEFNDENYLINFTSNSIDYEINLKRMYQTNLKNGTVQDVVRRPHPFYREK
ncbi:hypothetical protein HELRODRAFT_166091 [Helobdella robusta]|uniref:Uncharacterized protein n=1 Tax=Helobdella robusta TaxID=6412 RepID=T1EXR0_HELRO|nr:hypothetical protein HELRODRAFT_166091 [Helobdella robusta]ESN90424.1 hypothetical protein HELRODRAFT_166091 [Helobdella robusta]